MTFNVSPGVYQNIVNFSTGDPYPNIIGAKPPPPPPPEELFPGSMLSTLYMVDGYIHSTQTLDGSISPAWYSINNYTHEVTDFDGTNPLAWTSINTI